MPRSKPGYGGGVGPPGPMGYSGYSGIAGGGGGGTPGGSDTQIQFNDGGIFGGNAGLTFNKTTGQLTGIQTTVDNASAGMLYRGTTTLNRLSGLYGAGTSLNAIFVEGVIAATNQMQAAPSLLSVTLTDKTSYAATKAVGRFRCTGTITNGDTATIDTKVYTFVTGTPATEGEVKIGASAALSMDNFMKAVNGTGTLGVEHYCTAHTTVDAVSSAYGFLNLQAKTAGSAGEVALAETSTRLTISGSTLVRQPSTGASTYLLSLSNQFNWPQNDAYHGQITGAIVNLTTSPADINIPYCHMYAYNTQICVSGTQTSNTRGNAYLYTGNINVTNCTVNNVYGFYLFGLAVYENAIASNVYGAYLTAANQSSGGATANAYGLYVEDWSGSATTAYNIYSAGATANNFIEGLLTIGTLSVGGVVTAAAGTGQLGLVTDAAGVLTSDGIGGLSFVSNLLVADLQTDLSTSGDRVDLEAGEDLVFGDLSYIDSTTSVMFKSLASNVTMLPTFVMAVESITTANTGKFIQSGYVRNDAWTWTPNEPLYTDETTPGAITQTKPTTGGSKVQIVGIAYKSNIIYFNPSYLMVGV